ncbi:MAG: hypothetical protein L6R00_12350 [Phycisphaerae bacterium]|nr:hypothetical protein [Phycisphaerae bacterium]
MNGEKKRPAVAANDGAGNSKSFPSPSYTDSWRTAKRAGDDAERAIAQWLRARGWECWRADGRADVDLLAVARIEVKNDGRCAETGRVAVEVSYRGRPSGIYRTSATSWAFVLQTDALLISIADLRRLAESGRFRAVPAGDGKRASVVLIPENELRAIARVIPLGGEA